MLKKPIYLDNNATTPLAQEVQQELNRIYQMGPLNSSSVHQFGQLARNELIKARRNIARYLKVTPSSILFTSGATEAINLALRSLFVTNKQQKIISTRAEHSAVYQTLQQLQQQGAKVHFVPLDQEGQISLPELEKLLPADAAIFSYANSETGILQNLEQIRLLLLAYDTPFLLDAVTWMGKEKVLIPKGIDFACFSGHKFHAPQGVGFAFFSNRLKLHPQITGGGQEYNLRSGTPNLPGIVALAKAVEMCQNQAEANKNAMQALQRQFEQGISSLGLSHQIHGIRRLCNTTCVYFKGIDAEGLFMSLDMKGVIASIGSACSSGSLEPSRVLLEMGLDPIIAKNSLRFSFSRYTTEQEITQSLQILQSCLLNKVQT